MTIMNNALKLNIEGLSKYFRTNSNKNAISFEDLSRYFYLYKIINKEIDQLRDTLFIDQVQDNLHDFQWERDIDQN